MEEEELNILIICNIAAPTNDYMQATASSVSLSSFSWCFGCWEVVCYSSVGILPKTNYQTFWWLVFCSSIISVDPSWILTIWIMFVWKITVSFQFVSVFWRRESLYLSSTEFYSYLITSSVTLFKTFQISLLEARVSLLLDLKVSHSLCRSHFPDCFNSTLMDFWLFIFAK